MFSAGAGQPGLETVLETDASASTSASSASSASEYSSYRSTTVPAAAGQHNDGAAVPQATHTWPPVLPPPPSSPVGRAPSSTSTSSTGSSPLGFAVALFPPGRCIHFDSVKEREEPPGAIKAALAQLHTNAASHLTQLQTNAAALPQVLTLSLSFSPSLSLPLSLSV